ncbi:hypothetical protein [Pedobacter sp. UYP30]|uniref:hypothetical protein n=1 Tax=Pedobacter sp. UYP30 TaxID=1756400 RepID=UPI003396FC45
MMKPRKEERYCRKQVATFVFATNCTGNLITEYTATGVIPITIGRQDFYAGSIKEQEKSVSLCKIERGNKQHGCG